MRETTKQLRRKLVCLEGRKGGKRESRIERVKIKEREEGRKEGRTAEVEGTWVQRKKRKERKMHRRYDDKKDRY